MVLLLQWWLFAVDVLVAAVVSFLFCWCFRDGVDAVLLLSCYCCYAIVAMLLVLLLSLCCKNIVVMLLLISYCFTLFVVCYGCHAIVVVRLLLFCYFCLDVLLISFCYCNKHSCEPVIRPEKARSKFSDAAPFWCTKKILVRHRLMLFVLTIGAIEVFNYN